MKRSLVDAESLNMELLSDQGTVVLDVRWVLGRGSLKDVFVAGHIPGARFVDLDLHLSAPSGPGGRHPLPNPEAFESAMRELGVGSGPVVCYDDGSALTAARAWWLLRYFGHRDVRVLDGGLNAWNRAGFELERGFDPVAEGSFQVGSAEVGVLTIDQISEFVSSGVLMDVRAADRYRGEVEPIDPVAGHIPGAISAPGTGNVLPDGRFRGAEELRERFVALGVSGTSPVGVYCGSGVAAAQSVLALEVAGFSAALYAGSWSEWVHDGDRSVAVGESPR